MPPLIATLLLTAPALAKEKPRPLAGLDAQAARAMEPPGLEALRANFVAYGLGFQLRDHRG